MPREWRLLHVTLSIAVSRGLLHAMAWRSRALFLFEEGVLSIVQISLDSIRMI